MVVWTTCDASTNESVVDLSLIAGSCVFHIRGSIPPPSPFLPVFCHRHDRHYRNSTAIRSERQEILHLLRQIAYYASRPYCLRCVRCVLVHRTSVHPHEIPFSSLLLVVLSRLLRRHFRFSSVWFLQGEAAVSHTVPHLPGIVIDSNRTVTVYLHNCHWCKLWHSGRDGRGLLGSESEFVPGTIQSRHGIVHGFLHTVCLCLRIHSSIFPRDHLFPAPVSEGARDVVQFQHGHDSVLCKCGCLRDDGRGASCLQQSQVDSARVARPAPDRPRLTPARFPPVFRTTRMNR